ncbi:RnfABCDGE type electron transport complex subunit D [bacterium]|nr:RnfABCDGE type electron transport complex subunit D [bacterium]
MFPRLSVAGGPHWRDGNSISRTQILWLLALLPTVAVSFTVFGFSALRVITLSIAFAIAIDAIVSWWFPSKDITANWSSALLGALLGLLLPVNAPWWLILVGCFIMIVVGKKLFGGLGAYPVHPTALAGAMLIVSWPSRFDYTAALAGFNLDFKMIEPIRLVKTLGETAEESYSLMDMLLGHQIAGAGNAMVLYLLIGGLFLLAARQISWHIPVGFLAGVALTSLALHAYNPSLFATAQFQLLAGSTILAAFFLVPDHTTSPVNLLPMFLSGLIGGMILVLIRSFSHHYDGVIFTVLLVNICNPLLDRIAPKPIVKREVVQDA